MSKRQQLYDLIMGAYAGLPEASQIASHHRDSVKEKNALKHWEIHGPQIQAEAEARRNQLRMQRLQDQMRQATAAARSRPQRSVPKTLQSTLAQGDSGVRGRRSRQQLMAQQQGVRAANQLQAGPFLGPQGSPSATPYGSSINLA